MTGGAKNEAVGRAAAAEALGRLGPDARAAVAVLKELTTDESADVRRAAAKAVRQIEQVEQ